MDQFKLEGTILLMVQKNLTKPAKLQNITYKSNTLFKYKKGRFKEILKISKIMQGAFLFTQKHGKPTCNPYGMQFLLQNQHLISFWSLNKKKLPIEFQQFLSNALIKDNFHEKCAIGEQIGKGGFSNVYKGKYQPEIGEAINVAIKFIDKQTLKTIRNGMEIIYNEILILRKVKNQNIYKMYDAFEDHEYLYIVVELLSGPAINKGWSDKCTMESLQNFTIKLLSVLKYLHRNHIIHRDIKPSNILFRSPPTGNNIDFCLIDFGLAQDINNKQALIYNCGTPGYMPPEAFSKENKMKNIRRTRGDIYSVACVIYLLFFKHNVFEGKHNEVLLKNKIGEIDFSLLDKHDNKKYCFIGSMLKSMLTQNYEDRSTINQVFNSQFCRFPPSSNQTKQDYRIFFDEIIEESCELESNMIDERPKQRSKRITNYQKYNQFRNYSSFNRQKQQLFHLRQLQKFDLISLEDDVSSENIVIEKVRYFNCQKMQKDEL